jgi:hypothetical protein
MAGSAVEGTRDEQKTQSTERSNQRSAFSFRQKVKGLNVKQMGAELPTSNLTLFITASLILLLTPGPVVLYIVARSVDQGRTAGFVSVLGAEAGNLFHAVAAALEFPPSCFRRRWRSAW